MAEKKDRATEFDRAKADRDYDREALIPGMHDNGEKWRRDRSQPPSNDKARPRPALIAAAPAKRAIPADL